MIDFSGLLSKKVSAFMQTLERGRRHNTKGPLLTIAVTIAVSCGNRMAYHSTQMHTDAHVHRPHLFVYKIMGVPMPMPMLPLGLTDLPVKHMCANCVCAMF